MPWTKSRHSGPWTDNCVEINYVKSTYSSNQAQCVEVAFHDAKCSSLTECVEVAHDHGSVLVRDSKDPNGPVLTFNQDEWNAFILGVKDSELALTEPWLP